MTDLAQLRDALAVAYGTGRAMVELVEEAGMSSADIPFANPLELNTIRSTWGAVLEALARRGMLRRLLAAVLADHDATAIHPIAKAYLAELPEAEVAPSGDPEASIRLLAATLHRHLGEDAVAVSQRLVQRLATRLRGVPILDATRLAIEYHLLGAEEVTPSLIRDVVDGRRERQLQDMARRVQDNPQAPALELLPHDFFSRALEREDEWRTYFEAVTLYTSARASSTLWRIHTVGFVAPQFLLAGLQAHFEDDWRRIVGRFGRQIAGSTSQFASYQASLWNTWLMWGPSIPICRCDQWRGVYALQFGYGDEDNSLPLIGAAGDAPAPFEAWAPAESTAGAVCRAVTGRLRWGPWLFDERPERPANAQRVIYDADDRYALVLQVDEARELDAAQRQAYFSAYLWLMFLVVRDAPGDGVQRLFGGGFPDGTAARSARKGMYLWRELVPVYVHANIADARALEMHRDALVANAIAVLRQIWSDRARLFPGGVEPRFHLVGGSDFTGCGESARFATTDLLTARLAAARDRLEEPLRSAIVLPGDGPRRDDALVHFSTCKLPEVVADYFAYVEDLLRDD